MDTGKISDGYHTFDELYDHRITLWIALCRLSALHAATGPVPDENPTWRAVLHSDGSSIDGWFVIGMGRMPGEQMTYHLPLSRWEETGFAETLERAPEWDKHTSADVLERIKNL